MASSIDTGPSDSSSTARSSCIRCLGTGAGCREWTTLRGEARGCASATALRKSSSSGGEAIEEFLRVERGHAAGPGAGDRLPVDVVLHVAGGEDALHAGGGGHAFG